MNRVTQIFSGGSPAARLAVVVRGGRLPGDGPSGSESDFLTMAHETTQLGLLTRPAGSACPAHAHFPRKVAGPLSPTVETLVVLSGRVRLSVFAEDGSGGWVGVLSAGDVACLLAGVHSLEYLDDCVLFEQKTGPYPGHEADKYQMGVPS